MLDAWAVADTDGRLIAIHEGSLEETAVIARRMIPADGIIYLDGMERVYEGEAERAPLPIAANVDLIEAAAKKRRLRTVSKEAPFDLQPAMSLAALGLSPIDTASVLEQSIEEAHSLMAEFFEDLPPISGKAAKVRVSKRWTQPLSSVDGMLGGNYKMNKRDPRQERAQVIGLSLAPNVMGFRGAMRPGQGETVCLRSTRECRATCLVFTGQNAAGYYANALKEAKTKALLSEPLAFARLLYAVIEKWSCGLLALEYDAYLRLNVYSDIPWELLWPDLFESFPRIQFYDYTKTPGRDVPPNYDLTFSYSGRNQEDTVYEVRELGRRVAVVFLTRSGRLPSHWADEHGRGPGLRVVDGINTDLRPVDPPNELDNEPVCVGLAYKSPKGIFTRAKPRKNDVFVVPCEVLDDDTVVVAQSPRHTFGLGEAAMKEIA